MTTKEEIIEERLLKQRKAISNPSLKLCECDIESAMYSDFGIIKCQYCRGVIQDIERVKKYIEYNTPTNSNKN